MKSEADYREENEPSEIKRLQDLCDAYEKFIIEESLCVRYGKWYLERIKKAEGELP